jgi:16S rRNA G527 N7-methylase RsmG
VRSSVPQRDESTRGPRSSVPPRRGESMRGLRSSVRTRRGESTGGPRSSAPPRRGESMRGKWASSRTRRDESTRGTRSSTRRRTDNSTRRARPERVRGGPPQARARWRGGLGGASITPPAVAYEQLIRNDEWSRLLPLVAKLGVDAEVVLPRLAQFVGAVKAWNRGVSNLVSRADDSRLVTRHVYESLEPGAWLRLAKARTWLDFGSGAGFPALPLAICGVGEKWTLVESRRPKTLFLRKAISDIGVVGVGVVHTRLELMIPPTTAGSNPGSPGRDQPRHREEPAPGGGAGVVDQSRHEHPPDEGAESPSESAEAPRDDDSEWVPEFDLDDQEAHGLGARVQEHGPEHGIRHGLVDGFTSRATMSLGVTLRHAAPFVRVGGSAFLWKGSRREEEMAEDRSWEAEWEFDGLFGIADGQSSVCRFKRRS